MNTEAQLANEQRYGEFSLRLHERSVAQRIPLAAAIEVTRRCPLQCAQCYNNLPLSDVNASRAELTCEEHCRILDELAGAGCLWILFTGGEIFSRKDFLDIYIHAKRKGFLITLFTNGVLVTPEIADHLAEWRPFSIGVTLYGRTKATYERITGTPGSYERCMRGIALLLERGLPLALKSVIVSLNRHEVDAMRSYAEELGVPFRLDAMINPRIDGSRKPLAVRLVPAEIVRIDLEDPKRLAHWRDFTCRLCGPDARPQAPRTVYECGAGVNSLSIDPNGRMSMCLLSGRRAYDLRAGTFREGWNGLLRAARTEPAARVTKCTDCSIKALCGMCPANGELEAGDPESPVAFLCQVAHLRANAFGVPVPAHGDCEYCEGK
jgi:radical SAM protein with 4Fe4S-binding SPASM domain